ncbi:MAG: sugar phosphate isomerase/epimerase [Clostridia bacterium]|nr:sugar phosphate isomerase/epimerase [Clostridia bacterium]
MRLGISFAYPHTSPTEWAEQLRGMGLGACVFPVDYTAPDALIDGYKKAAKDYDIIIAEVGAWKNLLDPNPEAQKANYDYVKNQLMLADHLEARCCVDISGACGEVWDGGYAENYANATFDKVVTTAKKLIEEAGVKHTSFTLEPMPWMLPWSAESYLELLNAVDSPYFGVHMDAINLMNSPARYFFCKEFLMDLFHKLSGKIKSVHVKDVALQRTLTLHLKEVPIGEGGFDVAAYARLTEAERPDMPFIIEHLAEAEAYTKAVAAVKKILAVESIALR